MHELARGRTRNSRPPAVGEAIRAHERDHPREQFVVEDDPLTGVRLKCYSRTADVEYWTALWSARKHVSYYRAAKGHLPHQLRATFRRWVPPGSKTLEAGCGLGHFTVAADALGYRAEGLDWSAATVERLRLRFPWIPWHVGDARQLAFPSETFDAVYSPGVCEHFEDGPTAVLLETRRVLRRRGIAVISAPCLNVWLWRHAARLAPVEQPAGSAFYQYAFSPDGMARLLTRLGFEVLQIRPYAALDTFVRHGGWRVPVRMRNVIGFALDHAPLVRAWGSTCIWVARTC